MREQGIKATDNVNGRGHGTMLTERIAHTMGTSITPKKWNEWQRYSVRRGGRTYQHLRKKWRSISPRLRTYNQRVFFQLRNRYNNKNAHNLNNG